MKTIGDIYDNLLNGVCLVDFNFGTGAIEMRLNDKQWLHVYVPEFVRPPHSMGAIRSETNHVRYSVILGAITETVYGFDVGHDHANWGVYSEEETTDSRVSPVIRYSLVVEAGSNFDILSGDMHQTQGMGLTMLLVTSEEHMFEKRIFLAPHKSSKFHEVGPTYNIACMWVFSALRKLDAAKIKTLEESLA